MANNITITTSVDGWVNLLDALEAEDYTGATRPLGEATVLNFNNTACYLHYGGSRTNNPATGTDGLPLSKDSAAAPSSAFAIPKGVDLATVWLYAASAVDVKIAVSGE